jgi:molecular chaperone GrpE
MNGFETPPQSTPEAPDDDIPPALVERLKAWATGALRDEPPPMGIAAELLDTPSPPFEKPRSESPDDEIPPALVERFKAWAAGALRDEPLPRGIAAELLRHLGDESEEENASTAQTDAYTLWSAMTALTQEVKLQGRSFKQLSDSLEPLRDMRETVKSLITAHGESLAEARRIADEALRRRAEADREIERRTQRRAQREMLGVLTDLRDRLRRGLENARTGRNADNSIRITWLDRLLGRTRALLALSEAAEALEKGYTLCLDRLEETLAASGVRELPCVGLTYDPRTMIAADIAESAEYPEGTVVEVFKTGYECNGEVFSHAHVKVVRAPRGAAAGTKEDEVNGK